MKWLGIIFATFFLMACTPEQAKQIESHFQDKPKISFYPYLYTKQFRFLSRQNIIGLTSGSLVLPYHEDQDLELEMNAGSWWGIWPREIQFINYFFAEQAKRVLGCGPLKAGATFTVRRGVYTLKRQKVIVGHDLAWQLKYNIPSMCQTPTQLPNEYFDQTSIYWDIPFSQNRIYP